VQGVGRVAVGREGLMLAGRALKLAVGLGLFLSIFKFNLGFANFKNLCRIHLNSENYEINFVG
jgi:hypothetical protein